MPDFRSLPRVDSLSASAELSHYPERVRVAAARAAVDRARHMVSEGQEPRVLEMALNEAEARMASTMEAVVNMSGVILHTGLGRARLAPSVVQHVADVGSRHSVVELNLQEGTRGDRQEHVRSMVLELTGAEDALVVNNAAAGVFLTLRALAGDKEVLLSRGEMVEIGGSFRVPDIVAHSGCKLVEVGCTNKTHLRDYEQAISENTAAILRCHTSNYKIVGFTGKPTLRELVALATKVEIPFIHDQGTGCLIDTSKFGLAKVPTVQDSIEAGVPVTIASTDKLLGGPQAGLILGARNLIQIIKNHPLARTVRVDKLTLSALEATLRLYLTGEEQAIPTVRYLSRPLGEIKQMADALARASGGIVEEGLSEIGGGSAPGTGMQTWRVGLTAGDAAILSKELRLGDPHILGRIEDGKVWLDPRTVEDYELEAVICRLKMLQR